MGIIENASAILEKKTPANRVYPGRAVSKRGPWDFLGNVPVPLRPHIHNAVGEIAAPLSSGSRALRWTFPHDKDMERLRFIRNLEDYPDMVVSAKHGDAFNRRFYESHVISGAFSGCQPDLAHSAFTDAALIDESGSIGVYAVAPFVFLIDHNRLDGAPAPRRWADLMDPVYRGKVVFSGRRREGERQYRQYNKFFLLAMAQEFGLKGLAKIVRNVPLLMHSAQMPLLAGASTSPAGVYIAPWSMADMCRRRSVTEIVWPEDGALAYPLWLTVKASHRKTVDPIVNYFYGAELGHYLNGNRYAAVTRDCTSGLPVGAKLKWPGWDYVRHPAAARMLKAACQTFTDNQVMHALFLPDELSKCA